MYKNKKNWHPSQRSTTVQNEGKFLLRIWKKYFFNKAFEK